MYGKYSGFLDDIFGNLTDLSTYGINAATVTAITKAMISPTRASIAAVESAFADAGAGAPPELMEALWSRYYQAIADNPAYASTDFLGNLYQYLPYIAIGGIGLLLILSAKRTKG